MAERKASDVERWLAQPDPLISIVLFYGPDRGLVSERAKTLALQSGFALDDPFSVVRIDAYNPDKYAGRLVDEASTISMFAQRRLIWVKDAATQKAIVDDIRALCGTRLSTVLVILEGGDLKKGAPLRVAVETCATGMALPCFPDQAKDLDRLIDAKLRGSGLSISDEARFALHDSLGADRLANRSEIEKLLLYVSGVAPEITLEHWREIAGDVASISETDAVDAALVGDLERAETSFRRLGANRGSMFLIALLRQLQFLHPLLCLRDGGKGTPSSLVAMSRPPIYFARRSAVEAMVRLWEAGAVQKWLDRTATCILDARKMPALAASLANMTLIDVASEAVRSRHR